MSQRISAFLLDHDRVLIGIMGVLAACGLIYQYLLAHYAGRILGAVETTIYIMIGLMIVAMGVGAFLAKWVKNPFAGFAGLEVAIGFLGGCSVLIIASAMALSYTLPVWLQDVYGLHASITVDGGVVAILQRAAFLMPFVCGFLLGIMIGMEIPLIARIREIVHNKHLLHNTGTIYGADYIGAGIGAAIWVTICLNIPIMMAAVGTAAVNALMGILFLWRYQSYIKAPLGLWVAHGVLLTVLLVLAIGGVRWVTAMNNTLFKDKVVFTTITPYQHLALTERHVGRGLPKLLSLYINGRLQFSSSDEMIYHSFLTYPAMLASARHDHILVIGGGDGLAVRELLRWSPQSITLVDLDPEMVRLFSGKDETAPVAVSEALLALNENAFLDPRVQVITGDAFIEVEKLISARQHYDVIIVDLPDPSHPDLNKLYSDYFYNRLKTLLSGDGAIAIQSTSPFHAKNAFLSIGKTLESVGFNTEQYRANVPTFGEWGWTIAVPHGRSALQRIQAIPELPIANDWLSKALIEAAFVFPPSFLERREAININRLGSHALYQYHYDAWDRKDGIFFATEP